MRSLCDQKKTDNHREVSKVSERFYWSRQNVSDRSPDQIGRELSFEHAQKTDRDKFSRSEVPLVAQRSQRGLILVADRSPTVRRSVSPRKRRRSSQCSGGLSMTDQRWGGDRSALYRRLVGDQLQSGFQACANHSAMGLQTSPTCLRMTPSFRNKCTKRSYRLLKIVRKILRKRDLLAIQGLNQYCLRLLLINRLYPIMATIAAFWFTLCRHINCNCLIVNILKTCKEMIRL